MHNNYTLGQDEGGGIHVHGISSGLAGTRVRIQGTLMEAAFPLRPGQAMLQEIESFPSKGMRRQEGCMSGGGVQVPFALPCRIMTVNRVCNRDTLALDSTAMWNERGRTADSVIIGWDDDYRKFQYGSGVMTGIYLYQQLGRKLWR